MFLFFPRSSSTVDPSAPLHTTFPSVFPPMPKLGAPRTVAW